LTVITNELMVTMDSLNQSALQQFKQSRHLMPAWLASLLPSIGIDRQGRDSLET